MSSPLHKHEAPQWNFLETVLSKPADTGGHSGAVLPKSLLCTRNFVVLIKICFKHMIKTNLSPLKMYFAPKP